MVVEGDSLEQGDILRDCPVFIAPADLDVDSLPSKDSANRTHEARFDFRPFNLVVMSQTCDLVKGREKVQDILLCPLYGQSDFEEGELATTSGWENARKGRYPAYHVLNGCELSVHRSSPVIVSFRQVFSLPLGFLRKLAIRQGERVRLLPPYREHLSQAFARFFMRVGLPVDIPAFK
jgi:hypothetical protein